MIEAVNFTLYESVTSDLINKISTGRLKDGDKLPSVSQLCELYSTSDSTIRKSISVLKSMGLIYSVSRVGYYVAGNDRISKQIFHFNEKSNFKNGGNNCDILSVTQVENNDFTAEFTQKRVMRIERLYSMDVLPIYYKVMYLPFKARIGDRKGENWIKEIDEVFSSHFIHKKLIFSISENSDVKKKLFVPEQMKLIEIKKTFSTETEKIAGVEYIYAPAFEFHLEMSHKNESSNMK